MQHTSTHCITLQHTATHCNTLQLTPFPLGSARYTDHVAHTESVLQHTATHCNALQHTATHRNTLPHAAPDAFSSWSNKIHRSRKDTKKLRNTGIRWGDSCVTWLIHMCDMTQSYVRHDSITCKVWLIQVCAMTHPYVAWLIYVCAGVYLYVWHKESAHHQKQVLGLLCAVSKYINTNKHVCTHVCIYIYTYLYMYRYIHINIYVYIYMYIYI